MKQLKSVIIIFSGVVLHALARALPLATKKELHDARLSPPCVRNDHCRFNRWTERIGEILHVPTHRMRSFRSTPVCTHYPPPPPTHTHTLITINSEVKLPDNLVVWGQISLRPSVITEWKRQSLLKHARCLWEESRYADVRMQFLWGLIVTFNLGKSLCVCLYMRTRPGCHIGLLVIEYWFVWRSNSHLHVCEV